MPEHRSLNDSSWKTILIHNVNRLRPQFPQCGFSATATEILKRCGVSDFYSVNVLEDADIRQGIKEYANWPTIPQLYVNGEFVGGCDIMREMYANGELQQVLGTKPA